MINFVPRFALCTKRNQDRTIIYFPISWKKINFSMFLVYHQCWTLNYHRDITSIWSILLVSIKTIVDF